MLRQNTNALGIIFPNSYDNTVPELVTERAMASIPFAGRYRMVDFVLSSMANCGISNVSIVVRKNYHSLMDHLGTGREWDMARRHGGLNIVPPFAEKGVRIYSGRVEALGSILNFLENQKENIPDTPDPIFFRISTGVICPPISMINAPDTIPVSNTTNTLIPTIPPINTSTYGITCVR